MLILKFFPCLLAEVLRDSVEPIAFRVIPAKRRRKTLSPHARFVLVYCFLAKFGRKLSSTPSVNS